MIVLFIISIFQIEILFFQNRTIKSHYFITSQQNVNLNSAATLNGLEAQYLIITHDNFEEAILPLAERKVEKGLDTKIITLSDIGSNTAQGIFNYIRNCYQSWNDLEYVLLVGDVEYIPTHYIHEHPYYTDTYTATDLYYGTMGSSTIGNDIFQDIFVGRLPVKSSSEVDTIVNKILHFESSYDPSSSWMNDILCAAHDETDSFFEDTSEEIVNHLEPMGFDITRVYTGGSYTGTTQDVINAINQDVFFINHRNHGNRLGWGHPSFNIYDIDDLDLNDHYPTMFSINCESGWFDHSSYDCFGEALLKEQNKGLVGFIGASRVSYSGYNDMLDKGLIDSIWSGFIPGYENMYGPAANLGKVLAYGKKYVYDEYYLPGGCDPYPWGASYTGTVRTFELFNLLGDPEFSFIDIQSPSWIQVPTDQSIETGSFSYDLDACDNFYIDRWEINSIHFEIDANGVVTINGVLDAGEYDIEVRAYDSSNNYCSAQLTFSVAKRVSGKISEFNLPYFIFGLCAMVGTLAMTYFAIREPFFRVNSKKL